MNAASAFIGTERLADSLLRPREPDVGREQIDFKTASLHVRRVKNGTPSTHPNDRPRVGAPASKGKHQVAIRLRFGTRRAVIGAEISTLLTSNAQIVHSSFYDGDLEAFIYQAAARGLPQRIPLVLTVGETSLYRLGAKLPDGAIIGARGPRISVVGSVDARPLCLLLASLRVAE